MAGWGNNPFALLDEDESGDGKVHQPVKAAAPAAAKVVKEEPKAAANKNVSTGDKKDSNRKPNDNRQQGERRERAPRAREERDDVAAAGNESNQISPSAERAAYRPRAQGGERRERGVRANPGSEGSTRAPRQYDRRSGTGRGREDKRHGAGRGNWGSNEQEISDQTQEIEGGHTVPASADAGGWGTTDGGAEWGVKTEFAEKTEGEATEETNAEAPAAEAKPPRELTEEEKARQAERELEAKQMTLEEYKKVKKSLDIALPPARKAGEGEDEKQWAGFIAAKSDKHGDDEKGDAKKEDKKKEPKKVAVPADMLKFKGQADKQREFERRDRRERDGGERRERRDDRQDRPPRAQQQQRAGKTAEFNIANDFPALKA